jgi:hypothetical protein
MRNTSLNSNSLFKEIIEMCSVTLSFDAMTLHILLAVTSTNFVCNLRKADPMGFKNGFPKCVFFGFCRTFAKKLCCNQFPNVKGWLTVLFAFQFKKAFIGYKFSILKILKIYQTKNLFLFHFCTRTKTNKVLCYLNIFVS